MARPYTDEERARVQQVFLDRYSAVGEKHLAADAAGTTWKTIRSWRKTDPEFDQRVRTAISLYRGRLGEAAHKRGVDGVEEAVYWNGTVVGTKRVYSDRLLLAHLARHMPGCYGPRVTVDEVKTVRFPQIRKMRPEDAAKLAVLLEQIAKSAPDVDKDEGAG
jgi:hypothetical protein